MTGDTPVHFGPGEHLVAVIDGVSLLILDDGPPGQLLDLARAHAVSGASDGRSLARSLARVLTGDDADALPAFGAVAGDPDELVVFLYGPVQATAVSSDGSQTDLSGAAAATWVDRVLPEDVESVLLAPAGAEPGERDTPFELRDGVVPGGWLLLEHAGAPTGRPQQPRAATAPPVVEPPTEEAPTDEAVEPPTEDAAEAPTDEAPEPPTEEVVTAFESIELTPDRDTIREPLPVETDGDGAPPEAGAPEEPAPADEAEGELVEGILCSRQHFNHPEAAYCSACGISMVHQTHNLVERERPPLGFLVFDDGSTFTLDDQYVLGRDPETDALVKQDEARPLALDDPELSISRSHTEVRLVGWDVQMVDRGSTNGTHVWDDDTGTWQRLEPGEPHTIDAGARVAVGQRTFVYESPHGR